MQRAKIDIDPVQTGILNRHVLAALSGGADSVALVHLLNEKRREGKIRLTLAHFEHGIRGEESQKDRAFVVSLAERLGLSLIAESGSVPAECERTGEGLESCARRLRHEFLHRAREMCAADVIATAHHKDDQAETVLMHILRGGGLSGARGMRESGDVYVRPLLKHSKNELIQYLLSIGETWREDASNFVADNPRNLIRLEAMPALLKAYPGARDALCRFSEIAQGEDEYMDRAAQAAFCEAVDNFLGVWRIKNPENTPCALLRRAIRKISPDFGFEEIESIRTCTLRTSLPGGWWAMRREGTIFIVPPLEKPDQASLSLDGKTVLKGICEIDRAEEAQEKSEFLSVECLNPLPLSGACVRTRQDGDFMRPLGMGGKKKLVSDIMTDRKIPLPLRDRLPVVAKGNEVFWIAGHIISEAVRVEKSAPFIKLKARLTYRHGGEIT